VEFNDKKTKVTYALIQTTYSPQNR